MERFSEKVFLQLKMPTEEVSLSDEKRIRIALETLGYEPVNIPLSVMRKLYPLAGMPDLILPLPWFAEKTTGQW